MHLQILVCGGCILHRHRQRVHRVDHARLSRAIVDLTDRSSHARGQSNAAERLRVAEPLAHAQDPADAFDQSLQSAKADVGPSDAQVRSKHARQLERAAVQGRRSCWPVGRQPSRSGRLASGHGD